MGSISTIATMPRVPKRDKAKRKGCLAINTSNLDLARQVKGTAKNKTKREKLAQILNLNSSDLIIIRQLILSLRRFGEILPIGEETLFIF